MRSRPVTFFALALLTIITSSCSNHTKLKIPYFDELTMKEICGGQPKYCQPTNCDGWAPVDPPIDCYGGLEKWLGRKYTNFYNTHKFVDPVPTKDDIIDNIGVNKIEGTIDEDTKHNFQAKIQADLVDLFRKELKALPEEVGAEVEANVNQLLSQAVTAKKINLIYKRVYLKQCYVDDVIRVNMYGLGEDQKISTGISVITVEGDWSSNIVKKAFAAFEASAGYKKLSIGIEGDYKKTKERVLAGKFESLSMIFRVGFIKK